MLHETIQLSAAHVKPGAPGWPETLERMSKIQCGKRFLAGAILALMAANPSLSKTQAADLASAAIAEAVADSSRPANDTARDVNRKPLETLAFAGVRPGDKIADYAAGSGYFTRLFADVVGPQGHVYASVPSPLFKYPNIVKGIAEVQSYAATHPNVTVTFASAVDAAKYSEKLDLFWISQNYHDLHDSFMGPVDMAAFNRAVYSALKPGGVYLVLDHVAAKGSRDDVTDTLHRIEPSTVRREVEASGFTFEGESSILANPADPHTAGVFDPSIQGRTDQFILKFRRGAADQDAPPAKPASRDGQHDFDFNIGVWQTHIKRILDPLSGGTHSIELSGTVTVKKVWDGRAEMEEIEADGPNGHWEGLTLFLYNPEAHQWSQTFANSKTGVLTSPLTGAFTRGRGELFSQDTVNGRSILVRGVWSDITPDSHHFEESYSDDEGKTWAPAFVANLTRQKQ